MRSHPGIVPPLTLILFATACGPEASRDGDVDELVPRSQDMEPEWRSADPFQIRGDSKLGCRNLMLMQNSLSRQADCVKDDRGEGLGALALHDRGVRLHAYTDGFVPMPRLASKFQIDDGPDRLVAITVSMLGYVNEQGSDEPVQVRVLVDGNVVADPGPVTFFEQRKPVPRMSPRSFTFVTESGPGLHVVEVQRFSLGTNVWLHEQSLRIDVERLEESEIAGVPPQGTGLYADSAIVDTSDTLQPLWQPIPDSTLDFETSDDSDTFLMFSPVFEAHGDPISIRAVVDGDPAVAYPSSHEFDADEEEAPHAVMYTVPGLASGSHQVQWQWASQGTTDVHLQAHSTYALTGPVADPDFEVRVHEQLGEMTLSWEDGLEEQPDGRWLAVDPWRPVEGLITTLELEEISDAAVTFSADVEGERIVFAAPTVNGHALSEQEVVLSSSVPLDAGGRSYTFALKDLPAGDVRLGIAVRSTGYAEAKSALLNGAMAALVKRRVGPDLAVGARTAAGSMKYDAPIEPVVGDTPLLPILFDAERDDIPSTAGFAAVADQLLFGADPSVANMWSAMSRGRATLSGASPLLVYTGSNPGGDGTTNYYWDKANFDCDAGSLYKGAAEARWALALRAAESDGFPFSDYDRDRNLVLTPDELSIIVYQPDVDSAGSSTVNKFKPYCDGGPFIADGVQIRTFAQINTPIATQPVSIAAAFVGTTVHELGHVRLGLDDVYGTWSGLFDPGDGSFTPDPQDADPLPGSTTRVMNTDPRFMSLMSSGSTRLAQLDGYHKLHLGWATPRIPVTEGHVFQPNVAASDVVTVLPRRRTDAREYFLLEARNQTGPTPNPAYDTSIDHVGMAADAIGGRGPGGSTTCCRMFRTDNTSYRFRAPWPFDWGTT
jgi:hypothetical protein